MSERRMEDGTLGTWGHLCTTISIDRHIVYETSGYMEVVEHLVPWILDRLNIADLCVANNVPVLPWQFVDTDSQKLSEPRTAVPLV